MTGADLETWLWIMDKAGEAKAYQDRGEPVPEFLQRLGDRLTDKVLNLVGAGATVAEGRAALAAIARAARLN